MDLVVTMYPDPAGQDGHCGNFNGNPNDDPWGMSSAEATARLGGPSSATESSPPLSPAEVANGSECTAEARTNATAMCTALCGGDIGDSLAQTFIQACVFDMCRTGELAEDFLVSDCLMSRQVRAAVDSASSSYVSVYPDSFCEDDDAILFDNRWKENYKKAPFKYDRRSSCEALCNDITSC